MDDVLRRLVEALDAHDPATLPLVPLRGARALAESCLDFEHPRPLQALVTDVAAHLRAGTCHASHPRHFGLFNPTTTLASVAADALVARFNPQLSVAAASPFAAAVERHTLAALASRLGLDPAGLAMTFTTGGAVATPAGPFDLTIPVGADAGGTLSFAVDLTGATQYGASFSTTEIAQDGYGTGRLSGFTADDTGMLVGRYSNGQTRPQGQIVLANFINPQGLVPLGNNSWVEGAAAGQATLGAPGSGILGSVEAGALENSNVDLTAELVNMITAQRFYQANAQTIRTHDQILQTIVNLR